MSVLIVFSHDAEKKIVAVFPDRETADTFMDEHGHFYTRRLTVERWLVRR